MTGPPVRRLPTQFVVCHANLLGDNLLVDEDGVLSALDWDSAYLAPQSSTSPCSCTASSRDPAEAAKACDGLRRWGSAQWEHLDRTLGLVRNGLDQR